jgi:hypothetical protein
LEHIREFIRRDRNTVVGTTRPVSLQPFHHIPRHLSRLCRACRRGANTKSQVAARRGVQSSSKSSRPGTNDPYLLRRCARRDKFPRIYSRGGASRARADIIRASSEFDGRNCVRRALTAIRVIRGHYHRPEVRMIVAFVTFLQAPGREGIFTPILFLPATRYSSPCAHFYDPERIETRTREIHRRDPLRKQTNRLCQSRLTMADTRNDVISFEPRTPSRLGCCVAGGLETTNLTRY